MKYAKLSDKEKSNLIKKLYTIENKSFQEIAKEYETYANKIRRDAVKFKIPIRNKSEAQKNALKKGTHKHPTKGQKRSDEIKDKIGAGVMSSWESLSNVELQKRKDNAKKQWNNLSQDQKDNLIANANKAVRDSSKLGSKLEKFILNNLLSDGYTVEFHKEQILSNTKLQIDLFIPKMNVAIEVDGPSHFLPVWGEDVLNRNIKYDNKKTGLILGKGLVLIRIKQLKDFSKARASLIYKELSNILQQIENKFPDINNRTIEIGD